MEFLSILNDVLGPVMRGPSSSHTAGSYHIGRIARDLLGDRPVEASFFFDPKGSYARTYRQQGVDLALAAGLLGRRLTDRRFPKALEEARRSGLHLRFEVKPLPAADHPNFVEMRLRSRTGTSLAASAKSTGGGGLRFTRIEGRPVSIDGKSHHLLLLVRRGSERRLDTLLGARAMPVRWSRGNLVLLSYSLAEAPSRKLLSEEGVIKAWMARPVFYVRRGDPLFTSAGDMVRFAGKKGISLGETALADEARVLGLSQQAVVREVLRRYRIMKSSVARGLAGKEVEMQLLRPTAGRIFRAIQTGATAVGGIHAKAAARAMAVMHVSNSMGVVCAAPTGGSAGVLPGVLVTLALEKKLDLRTIALSLLAAGAVGLILARRGTLAAEVAGCQVEIGAAGAMAAAAVAEAAGSPARIACDAAAVSFQNTMGSVCDLVKGICEIPCHTRNAAAAASAFVCADLVLGGYQNPIPLDETIDAAYDSGRMLPPELRVTSLGGLALAPSARRLPILRKRRLG